MTTIRKVDHVAIAVASIAETVPLFCDTLQGEFIAGGDNDDTGIRLVHLRLPGFKLELMQPLRADSFLQRHLDERGPGFHHMTFFVDDLRTTVAALDGAGFRTTGADFSAAVWKEAFISPKAAFGALLQFVETSRSWDERDPAITLDDVLAGRVVWRDYLPCLREDLEATHRPRARVHFVDNDQPGAGLLPVTGLLRSRRQAEILAAILADPASEFPLSTLAQNLKIPYSSVHREIRRAEEAGVVTTRRFQNLRLVRANTASPYYPTLAGLVGKRPTG